MSHFDNGMTLTWLGHATWIVETPGGKRVLFDPGIHNPEEDCAASQAGDLSRIWISFPAHQQEL